MGRRKKPVTKDLIRKYFGKHARIRSRWFSDGFKITTATGGEVLISDTEFTVVMGGDDVYRAITLLANELWGGFTAYGSREAIMAWVAHGEAWGVNVRPGIKRGWFWRFVMIVSALYGLFVGLTSDPSGFTLAGIAGGIWWLMERSAKRKVQQLAAEIGFHFPRVHGTADAARDEDLEREGWV